MAVMVSFLTPKGIGSIDAPGIGAVRVREDLTVPATTTGAAEEGEVALIANGESSMVAVAFGSSPDADATAETSSTSAGFGVPAATTAVIAGMRAGDKISVKALS